MKYFLSGLFIVIITILTSLIFKNEKIFLYGTQGLAIGSVILSAIVSGLLSDSIYRRTAVEEDKERNNRLKRSLNILKFGIPSITSILIYYIFYA